MYLSVCLSLSFLYLVTKVDTHFVSPDIFQVLIPIKFDQARVITHRVLKIEFLRTIIYIVSATTTAKITSHFRLEEDATIRLKCSDSNVHLLKHVECECQCDVRFGKGLTIERNCATI
jgi:hypothetical protein